jgi:predicted nucleic acid-binding protein
LLKLLDTTALSNFVYVDRLDLLASALPEALTTRQVIAELRRGEEAGQLPVNDWQWLKVADLTPDELVHFERIRLVLDDGEASCLASVI